MRAVGDHAERQLVARRGEGVLPGLLAADALHPVVGERDLRSGDRVAAAVDLLAVVLEAVRPGRAGGGREDDRPRAVHCHRNPGARGDGVLERPVERAALSPRSRGGDEDRQGDPGEECKALHCGDEWYARAALPCGKRGGTVERQLLALVAFRAYPSSHGGLIPMSPSNELARDVAAQDEPALDATLSAKAVETAHPAGEISARISAILDSAEEEAEKIRDQSRAEAASIIRSAHAQAAERIDELTREPERLRAEAEQEAHALLAKARADAAEQISQAERQAAAVTKEAEQQATQRKREAEMQRRERALKDELAALSQLREQAGESVQDVVQVLQRTASDIDRRLGAIPDNESETAPENGKAGLRLLRRGNEE